MQKQFGVENDSEERKKREEKAMTMFRTLCTTLDALSSRTPTDTGYGERT